MNYVEKSVEIGGKTITFSTGKYAKQASGAVVASSGDTSVLVTAVVQAGDRPFDFLPLTVDYEERNGAYGTIPGGYLKREGRSERGTLIARVIDRPIRPMFPKHFRQELQAIATVMSFDANDEADVLALCGASAAFHISEAPMKAPVAGVRVCQIDGEIVLNPDLEARDRSTIELIVAGTAEAITMVEGGASEASEEEMLDALDIAHAAIKQIIACIEELRAEVGKEKVEVPPPHEVDEAVTAHMAQGLDDLIEALAVREKHARGDALKAARNKWIASLVDGVEDAADAKSKTDDAKVAWDRMLRNHMRTTVIKTNTRLDGRKPADIRGIWCEVGVASRAHGSAVFTRGETQVLATIALGTERDAQRMELPTGNYERRWMLSYKFPPFCTGEARPLRGPKRREIGHGALAHRALERVLPDEESWPYVMRSTADVLESNGSSSMATVCSSTLALMDAGVPLKAPVAGIAMGLIKEGDDFAVLSDILGDEDHLGDMDFKVTGSAKGITAFQMDCKIAGVSREIMATAMEQARAGRIHILDEMLKTLAEPRKELAAHAPRITTIHINTEKIRDLIGPGGKVIRGIQDECGVRVTVDDSGKVDVASTDAAATERALNMIREITQEAEIGALYLGIVKRIVDFGAFVEIFPGTDGLVHISHLAHERVDKVTDVLHEGDEVLVRVIDIDRSGKIRLSRKEALDGAN
ncbi:MAG: polyribonucleotide nucleotidyltransferase [Deltaproteobacteria bacterium]|nr:MAG: polyribonucleotide nucleotidyltransferase [Deltaproteobacteria bacterium]